MDQFCLENGFIQWFETSAKEDKCITEATKYLVNSILELETTTADSCSEIIDYNSNPTISLESYKNKNQNKKCCS